MSTLTWTDPTLTAQNTPVKKIHIEELRSAAQTAETKITDHTSTTNYTAHPEANASHAGFMSAAAFSLLQSASNVDLTTIDAARLGSHTYAEIIASINSAANAADPVGTIRLWNGSVSSIPTGYVLCDGQNGTPDLRDRFIVGAGSSYTVGTTGGANSVTLAAANIAPHYHAFGYHNNNNTGVFLSTGGTLKEYPKDPVTDSAYWNGSNGGRNSGGRCDGISTERQNLITTLNVPSSTTATTAHENRPPYYALCYIMRKTAISIS